MRHPPFLTGSVWPMHPAPQPDELLSSYITRIARAHSARPRPFWKAVAGVTRLLEVDFEPPPELIAILIEHVRIDRARIQHMTVCYPRFKTTAICPVL
jgi:hypothetical protein